MPSSASARAACLALAALLLTAPVLEAARKKRPTPTPTPTPSPTVTPTAVPFLRAAGACMRYEPGAYLVLSEVGRGGRVFHLDAATEITATPKKGARLRVLYEDGPDGPIARKIMPGPAEEKPGK